MAMTQAQIDAEIARKAAAGEKLAGNGKGNITVQNQSAYDQLMAGKTAATDPQSSSQAIIDKLNDAKLNSTLESLGKSRDAALSNLNAEKGAIQPKYYDARNQVSAGAQQSARNFAEYMAARGGASSGTNAQSELSRNMTTQGNLGTLGRQEAQAYTDIERRTSDLQNAYQSDLASARSGIESDRMQAMLQDYYNTQQRDLQIGGLLGVFNGQKTLAGQQFDYGKTRDQVGDKQWQDQFDYTKDLNERDFNYQVGRDDVSDKQWAQQFNESVKQNGIQNALSQVRASGGGGGGNSGLSLAQKISIWKISGQAPEGIPGVKPGTKVYDEVAARNAAEKSGGVKLWGAIKGVLGSLSGVGANSSGASDADISSYLNN